MNFYFNYFSDIGREQINCLLSTVHTLAKYLFLFHLSPPRKVKIKSAAKICACVGVFVSLCSNKFGISLALH